MNRISVMTIRTVIVKLSILTICIVGSTLLSRADSLLPKTVGDTLKLTPNESFFSPVGTLRAHLLDKRSGNIYNKYENYDYIYNWKVESDTVIFGVEVLNGGDLKVNPEMGVADSQRGSVISIYLDGDRRELKLPATGAIDSYKVLDGVIFESVEPGFHLLKLKIESAKSSKAEVGRLRSVNISGDIKAEAVMRRYRPYAVHCNWRTDSSEPVEMAVYELTVVNQDVNCYQPITSPFGYSGSPWSLDSRTFGGYNFSLWSYGKNDPVPPFYQESHLIATGANLTFGSYGHEGTGVKPRGNHPYIGQKTNRQVIALRKEPGTIYDTYWSYYLDPVSNHWKLYGCGKKFNKDGDISDLKTGAFVEVAGAASIERSGHEVRETRYRGWQRDASGEWHSVNRMEGSSRVNKESFREWSTVDNKFSMRMGGWGAVGNEKCTVILSDPDPTPEYLQGEYIEELYRVPATFGNFTAKSITKKSVKVTFKASDLGTDASAQLFWGVKEGLTKEAKWENKRDLDINLGDNSFKLDNLKSKTTYHYRVRVINKEGTTWSFDSEKFTTR